MLQTKQLRDGDQQAHWEQFYHPVWGEKIYSLLSDGMFM